VMEAVASGLPEGTEAERQARAWVLLSLLSGGVTLARAVPSQATGEQIAAAVQSAVLILAEGAPSPVT
jgi:TetR/AcrR family transcriptional repressor of nem operon